MSPRNEMPLSAAAAAQSPCAAGRGTANAPARWPSLTARCKCALHPLLSQLQQQRHGPLSEWLLRALSHPLCANTSSADAEPASALTPTALAVNAVEHTVGSRTG
jgi:hypothetical protein